MVQLEAWVWGWWEHKRRSMPPRLSMDEAYSEIVVLATMAMAVAWARAVRVGSRAPPPAR